MREILVEVPADKLEEFEKLLSSEAFAEAVVFHLTRVGEIEIYLVAYPGEVEVNIYSALRNASLNVSSVPLRSEELKKILFLEEKEIEERLSHAEAKLARFSEEWAPFIISAEEAFECLMNRLKILSITSKFRSLRVISGWVPRDEIPRIKRDLTSSVGKLVVVEEIETGAPPPTLVTPPKTLVPFQKLVNAFSIPRYNEVNPAAFIWLTFPLFFGFMFGDVGQGLLLMLAGILSYKYLKNRKMGGFEEYFVEGAWVIIFCGLGAVLFGIIYGNFFGPERLAILGLNGIIHVLDYPEGTLRLLLASLLIGVIHIASGLVIAIINNLTRKEYVDSIMYAGWLAFYIVFTYPIVLKALFPKWSIDISSFMTLDNIIVYLTPFTVVFLIEAAYLFHSSKSIRRVINGLGEYAMFVLEASLQSLSHTLSYMRLWALNIAHDSLMVVFITLSGMAYQVTPLGALLVEFLGNALVLLLESIIAFMHVLRLHWVEWFMKFYEGGGYLFKPYFEERKWTTFSDSILALESSAGLNSANMVENP